LKKIPLFSCLKFRELLSVYHILHRRSYVADEVIFDEGEEGLGMYIILEGEVKIIHRGMLTKKELATLGPGETFGDMSLIDGSGRSASAIASEPTRLLGFFRPEFLHLLETQRTLGSKLTLQLAKILAQRLRHTLAGEPAFADQ
jgi:CRP-like cAMP-binding protein